MQPKTCVVVIILLSSLACILLMPFDETPSIRNEATASEHNAKVLLLIRHGFSSDTDMMLQEEVGVMTRMLEEAGFQVIVASASGELIEGQTLTLQPNLPLADVKVNEYVGIIIPCMAKGSTRRPSDQEISLVKEAGALGTPLAAQRNAIFILAEAGVLAGKRYALGINYSFDKRFKEAIYGGKGVVQDGNIITSTYCPYAAKEYSEDDGTAELTELFIEAMRN